MNPRAGSASLRSAARFACGSDRESDRVPRGALLALLSLLAAAAPALAAEPAVVAPTRSATSTATTSEEWRELQHAKSATAAATPGSTSAPDVTTAPAAVSAPATLRLVYTGASQGIGSGRYTFELPERLAELLGARGGRLESVEAFHGAFVQGLSVIIAEDRRVETVVRMVAEGGVRCGEARPGLSVRTPSERLLYVGPEPLGPAFIQAIVGGSRRSYEVRRCATASGAAATVYTPVLATPVEVRWTLDELEARLALHVTLDDGERAQAVDLVGIPADEPSRRFRLLESLASADRTLWVDAGSFLDGASTVHDGELSAHRPTGLAMLERLHPAALVPGVTELLAGAAPFLAEVEPRHLPYLATNWASERPELELPEVLIREVETARGPVRVAFLGVIDPRVAELVPKLREEGITLEDPVTAVQRAVRTVSEGTVRPDLVVVLTIAAPEVVTDLVSRVRGIDLVVGDRAVPAGTRTSGIDLAVRPDTSERRTPAAVLPVSGISSAEIELSELAVRFALRRVAVQPQRTTESLESAAWVRAAVTRTRARLYPELDHPLLAAPAGGPLARLGDAEWRQLVCEATLRRTNADVVLLPSLPAPEGLPGPLTELLVANRLGTLDKLEVHYVLGSKLLELLRAAGDVVPTACGATIGARASGTVRGRGLEPEVYYRIVSTDRARVQGLDKLFEAAYSRRALDLRGPSPVRDEQGAAMTLRAAVIDALREARDQTASAGGGAGRAAVEPLLVPSSGVKAPIWTLRFTRFSLRLERFRGALYRSDYANVKESLVTSPSSFTFGADIDTSLTYDSAAVLADLRLRSLYTRLAISGADAQEPADDLRLSSSASLPGVSVALGPLALMPFTEVLLDSELTPSTGKDMTELPRQADLSLTLGAAAVPGPILKIVRLGAFLLGDLSDLDRPAQLGARAEVQAVYAFGPELRFESSLDARWYAGTSRDSDADLRFRTLLDARLLLPLVRWLDVSLFGRTFVFQGRVPETDRVSYSYVFGFALDLHGAFRL